MDDDDDDDDDASEVAAAAAAALALAEIEAKLKKDFKVHIKNFCKQAAKIDWSSLSAELNLGLEPPADRAIEPTRS